VLVDPAAVRARVTELAVAGASGDAERTSWWRMLVRLEEAEDLGWRSLAGVDCRASRPRSDPHVHLE